MYLITEEMSSFSFSPDYSLEGILICFLLADVSTTRTSQASPVFGKEFFGPPAGLRHRDLSPDPSTPSTHHIFDEETEPLLSPKTEWLTPEGVASGRPSSATPRVESAEPRSLLEDPIEEDLPDPLPFVSPPAVSRGEYLTWVRRCVFWQSLGY